MSSTLVSFGLGAVATVIGSAVARPLLVRVVAAGYRAKDAVEGAWDQAKVEAASVRQDALTRKSEATNDELKRLRAELASLKAHNRTATA